MIYKKTIACLILTTIIFFHSQRSFAQQLCAEYSVNKTIVTTEGATKTIADLPYKGLLYIDNLRSIYWKEPLYLDTYPTGSISYGDGQSKMIPMQARQTITLTYLDSGIIRHRVDNSLFSTNYFTTFQAGYQQWELLADTNIISGLFVQRAVLKDSIGNKQWDIWYSPNIPASVGPGMTSNLPGLLVEGYCTFYRETFTLTSYQLNCKQEPQIFTPIEFKEAFRRGAKFRRKGL